MFTFLYFLFKLHFKPANPIHVYEPQAESNTKSP